MMRVVATAGHVDHGKSTLVRALTGMEPDRWEEERRRGLTIDLGFVWAPLTTDGQPPRTVAFVDVPGHERFVANMLAGAGAVRAVLFVVAADDGWSAQSQEHLDILDLLGVPTGVVAITKAAAVAPSRVRDVTEDVGARLAHTTLAHAPIVVTDAVVGRGLDDLTAAMLAQLAAQPPARDTGRGRLWIDRSFTIDGAGTVVTGTLDGAGLAVGDEVALLPAGFTAKIRGLHALGQAATTVAPGARVAVNLAGVARDRVGRGDALVVGAPSAAAAWLVTDRVDAWVRALPGYEVGRRGAWHVHTGSAQVRASLHPLLGDPVTAEGAVRIVLERALPLQAGDRFVLREAGRRATLGGGQVLDPAPAGAVRGAEQRLGHVELLDALRSAATPGRRLEALVAVAGGFRPAAATFAAAGLASETAGRTASTPPGRPTDRLLAVGESLVDQQTAARWREVVIAALADHHRHAPSAPGPTKSQLAPLVTAAGAGNALAGAFIDHLVDVGVLVRHGPGHALPEHAPTLAAARTQSVTQLFAAIRDRPLAPPRLDDAAAAAGVGTSELQRLLQHGELVQCGEFGFAADAVAEAVDALRRLEAATGPFTAAQAKEAWATTRRYAIPLLEHLDTAGVTRFDGRHRRVVGALRPSTVDRR